MKGLAAALLCALASTTLAQTPTTDDCGDACHDGCGKAHMARLRADAGLLSEPWSHAYSPREALGDTDVLSYVLDIEVNPTNETITGSNLITVKSLVNGLTQFTFVLRSQYTVSSILLNSATPATATTPAANSYRRTITLDRPYNANEVFTVRIAYSGTAISRGMGSIEFTTQNGTAGQPVMVATLSEPYFAATWWPCKDGDVFLAGDNTDKATIDFSITAPEAYRSVANGVLASVTTPAAGKRKYRWVSNYPTATYLVAFATTVYNTWTLNYSYPLSNGGTGSMPVEFNIYPSSDTPTNRAAWERVVPMLAAFRPFYGEYPFVNEKYGIYEFNFSGGMEHQTNSGQGTFNEGVTAHELAHQWWGDAVTCRTWSDIWLNEGFATYSEALWEERKPGSSGAPAYRAAMNARKPANVGDSVYVTNVADVNRIFSSTYTYRKGGWVVHMLRGLVGDETFYDIMQGHRLAHEGTAATTDDFIAVANSVAGQDLTWFFRQWVYGIGAPAYAYGVQPFTVAGQNYARVSLRQTQNAAWPGAGAPAGYFAMPLDLRVETSTGSQTVKLNNNARTQNFVIPINGAYTDAALDPLDWVLNTAKTAESHQNGPPVVLTTSPAPSATLIAAPTSVQVTFSEAVTVAPGAITLTGPGGTIPGSQTYTAGTFTATFTPTQPLTPGDYTVSVSGVTSNLTGLTLDGDIPGTMLVNQPALPSGNGVAGGPASFTFSIQGSTCGTADFNNDGDIGTDQDIEAFFACLGGNCCPGCYTGGADFNADGDTGTDQDIESFFRVLGGGNC
ncbi:MAG TPA: M1 family aminopeptidase [Phycisphaerales bacterium]|nr:M1 family aminopeptidase [Phycisphaerales bacterium]